MTTPSAWRRLLRNARLRRVAVLGHPSAISASSIATNRWSVEGAERPRRLRADGRPFILAFWHGRLLMIPMAWQRLAPMHMLISAHRDGRIIADAVDLFRRRLDRRLDPARRLGGAAHDAEAAQGGRLRRHHAGRAARPGDARQHRASSMSPGSPACRSCRSPSRRAAGGSSRTWDRFHLALPFGRGVFLWGEPIEIAAELDEAGLERARRLVESRMNDMIGEADRRVGHATPPPLLARAAPAGIGARAIAGD